MSTECSPLCSYTIFNWLVSSGHSAVEGLCYLDSRYQMDKVSDFLRWVGAWGLFAAGPSLAKLGVSSSSDCLLVESFSSFYRD